MHTRYLIIALLVFASCSGNGQAVPANKKQKSKSKPSSGFSDTIRISFPAAVFYNPDSLQLEKIKAGTDSMIYESMIHDCFYQMRNARSVLKQYYPQVEIVLVSNARFLLFNKKAGEKECIDLDANNDPCGIYLTDGNQSPRFTDMTNIDTELGLYFTGNK